MKYLRLLFILILSFFAVIPTSGGVAFADETVYSDVLDDLSVDKKFNSDDYPINQTDYSIELIQIAESTSGELLVYIYQPSAGAKGIMAKKIRIRYPNSDTYNDYNLTLLSKNGVFYKYKVDGYITDYDSSVVREYNVVQIMRSASAELGDVVLDENNNKISYIQYPVNWSFTARYKDGQIYYGKTRLKSLVIEDKYCGQLLFSDATSNITAPLFGYEAGMLHFVAFNADIKIDELYEADVEYTLILRKRDYCVHAFGVEDPANYDEDISSERISKTLSSDVEEEYKAGIFSHKYKWTQIMSMSDFKNNFVTNSEAFFSSSLTEEAESNLEGKAWVLCIGMTEIRHTNVSIEQGLGYHEVYERYYINDETILRLQGKTNGVLFNLGVVDNYQTGDGLPDNNEEYGINEEWWKNLWEEAQEWLRILLIVLGCILLVIVLILFGPLIFKIIKFVFKIIFAPFRWLFGRSSARKYNGKRR